jgi:hypothetical protein
MITVRTTFSFIARHRRVLSTLSTVAGFLFHVFLFQAIDLPVIEAILAAHLAIVSGAALIGALPAAGERTASLFMRVRALAPLLYQYSTGALLSGFLILYAASGSLVASWPFLALVLVAAVGNEATRLEQNLVPFQTTLFALNLVLFACLLSPIVLGDIGQEPFLVGVAVALTVYILFSFAGWILARRAFRESVTARSSGAVAVFGLIVIFYFIHVIPPIPLAAKEIDFYHAVAHSGGAYIVLDEPRAPFERFFDFPGVTLHLAEGEPVYVYTAIFAPAHLGTTVVHRWERYDAASHTWATDHTVSFPISGGRQGGYRGYSLDVDPAPGLWRVSVETAAGAIIGRGYLTIVRVSAPVATVRSVLE